MGTSDPNRIRSWREAEAEEAESNYGLTNEIIGGVGPRAERYKHELLQRRMEKKSARCCVRFDSVTKKV